MARRWHVRRWRMRVAPLKEPYIGAWMQHAESYKALSTEKQLDRQRWLQQLQQSLSDHIDNTNP